MVKLAIGSLRSTYKQKMATFRAYFPRPGVTARNGQQSTLRLFVNDLTKRNAPEFDYRITARFLRKLLPETRCFVVEVQCFSRRAFELHSTRRQSSLAYLDFRFRVRIPT